MTKNQAKARARNWIKRGLAGAGYSLKSMVNLHHISQGISQEEKQKIYQISEQIFDLLSRWEKSPKEVYQKPEVVSRYEARMESEKYWNRGEMGG